MENMYALKCTPTKLYMINILVNKSWYIKTPTIVFNYLYIFIVNNHFLIEIKRRHKMRKVSWNPNYSKKH
jgi:hypothetical protein